MDYMDPNVLIVGTHHHHLPKNSKVFISLMPCRFSKRLQQNPSYLADKHLSLHQYLISQNINKRQNINIWQSTKRIAHTEQLTPKSSCVKYQGSNFKKSLQEFQKCHNRILVHFMTCDTPFSSVCEHSPLRVFQPSFKDIWNILLELSAGQVRQNCRATFVILPGSSVATISPLAATIVTANIFYIE